MKDIWVKKRNIFSEHHAQVPVVDIYPNGYKIYYSTRNESGRSIPMSVFFSKDFSQYNSPIKLDLKLGAPGSFDWSGIMPTDIITLDNGTKYLYYIGWSRRLDVPYHNNLGLAISEDHGSTWRKFSNGPVFHTSHKEPGYVGTVEIMIEDGIWKMWYLSCREWTEYQGIMEPIYDIKFAYSKNGIEWEPIDKTCISLCDQEGGISAARVVKKENGEYKMWFSVRNKIDYRDNPEKSYRIESATSLDGLEWKRTGIEIQRSEGEGWDSTMVAYPYIIEETDKKIMFYNGNGFGKSGIGYAVSKNPF